MLKSDYKPLSTVVLPYRERQCYMHSFDLAKPVMKPGYEDYLEIVRTLCAQAGAKSGIAHMTVDEKIISAGRSQRRPKPHVDGRFTGQEWSHGPGWLHYCNQLPVPRMSVIVASSVRGCRAWKGDYEGVPDSGGDLSHLVLGEGEVLPAGVGYLLAPDCIHESMVFERETQRSFLRIALP